MYKLKKPFEVSIRIDFWLLLRSLNNVKYCFVFFQKTFTCRIVYLAYKCWAYIVYVLYIKLLYVQYIYTYTYINCRNLLRGASEMFLIIFVQNKQHWILKCIFRYIYIELYILTYTYMYMPLFVKNTYSNKYFSTAFSISHCIYYLSAFLPLTFSPFFYNISYATYSTFFCF